MLSSQVSPSMRLGSSLAKQHSTTMLLLASPISRGARTQQQIRTLRLGIWSSYLHSNLERELHRHHRLWKHRYEVFNQKEVSDPQNLRSARRHGFKGFMCSASRAKDSWSPASEVEPSKRQPPNNESQGNQGRGIEDVEQSALNRLLSSRDGIYDFIRDRSGILSYGWSRAIFPSGNTIENSGSASSKTSLEGHSASGTVRTEGTRKGFQSQRSENMEPEYEIDPITNRKVFKNRTAKATQSDRKSIDIPVKTYKGDRAHCRQSTPPDETGHKLGMNGSKAGDQVQDGLRDYDRQTSYKAFRFNEPDGKPREETILKQDGLEQYDNRTSYGAFRYLEPDGKSETDAESDAFKCGLDKLDKENPYQASRPNNAKGIPLSPPQSYSSSIDTTEDLDLLRPSDVHASSGIIGNRKKENEKEKLSKRRELEKEFQKAQAQEAAYAEELASVRKREELQKFAQDLRNENSELQNHVAHVRGKVNAKIAELEADLSTMSSEKLIFRSDLSEAAFENDVQRAENEYLASLLGKEAPARIQTALDRTLSVGPGSRTTTKPCIDLEKDPYSKEPQGLQTSYAEEVAQGNATKTDEPKRPVEAERDPYSKKPMGLETNFAEECVKVAQHEAEKDPYSKKPMGLETHYAEECAQLSKHETERDPYSKEPMGLETSYAEECAQNGDMNKNVVFSCYESPGSGNSETVQQVNLTHEEKRKRNRVMKQKDKDLVREVRSIYEDSYGTIDCKHRQPSEAAKISAQAEDSSSSSASFHTQPTPEVQQPTLYKILAYDATMQSISEASTTSIVNDSASALTPAEALLRLSNPAKFFPFFEPLKREGYEIVSGSGDVLVFRKVRAAEPKPKPPQDQVRNIVNPIDGMETRPATGNFASPTGFVNHDVFSNSEPPFKSNIDVRREEPVFSGKKNWQDSSDEQGRHKKGRAKRLLIGAAWVGACSYAVGVVAEFFRTGGMDGRGPQGF